MEIYAAVVLVIVLLTIAFSFLIRRIVIYEYQRGVWYRRGKFKALLPPGEHFYFRPWDYVLTTDVRTLNVTIPGQEVLSADHVGIKISLVYSYKVVDPYLAITQVASYTESLYLLVQLALREVISAIEIDNLLTRMEEIGGLLFEKTTARAKEMGIELLQVNIKDVMFPGELKNIFAQVVNARKEGLAALERARGESAAMRNLANAANLMDNNPSLRQLRLFQVLEKSSGNTVVFMPQDTNLTNRKD